MNRFAVVIIYPNAQEVRGYENIAESIYYGLKSLGFDTVTSFHPVPGRRNIIIGAHNIRLLSPDYHIEPGSIIYNLEWVGEPDLYWLTDRVAEIHKNYELWDFCRNNVESFLSYKINVNKILPICYSSELTKIHHKDPEMDVLFVGNVNERRAKILNGMQQAGLTVGHLGTVYGPERDDIISRAKVLLNIQSVQPKIYEMVRVSYYLANKCAVLSERAVDHCDYLNLELGIEFADYNELVDKAVALCNNQNKRRDLAQHGFEIFSKYKIEDYLNKVL